MQANSSKERSNVGFATLKKRKSEDGFWNVIDGIELGKSYMVDLGSRRQQKFMNMPTSTVFECEVVDAMQDDESWMPIPTELLDFD